jgi:hypothetical protein
MTGQRLVLISTGVVVLAAVIWVTRSPTIDVSPATDEPPVFDPQLSIVEHLPWTPQILVSEEEIAAPDGGGVSSMAEARDRKWASTTKAMLDAVIRSLGGSVWDIRELQCHRIYCEAVVIHDPSLIHRDQEARARAADSFEQNLKAAMERVYPATPRLGAIEVSDMYSIVTGVSNEVVHSQNLATRIIISGPSEPGD